MCLILREKRGEQILMKLQSVTSTWQMKLLSFVDIVVLFYANHSDFREKLVDKPEVLESRTAHAVVCVVSELMRLCESPDSVDKS